MPQGVEVIESQLFEIGLTERQQPSTFSFAREFLKQIQESFGEADQIKIIDAMRLMVEVHSDQEDYRPGIPYAQHPITVASQLLTLMKETPRTSLKRRDTVIAALLHDTVEDNPEKLLQTLEIDITGIDPLSVRNSAFEAVEVYTGSKRVAQIVKNLTNPRYRQMFKNCKNEDEYIKKRNAQYAIDVSGKIQDPDVALIKFCDLSANLFPKLKVPVRPDNLRFIMKYQPLIAIFVERFDRPRHGLNISSRKKVHIIDTLTQANVAALHILKEHSLKIA